jgi:hypothetical protein
VTQLAQAPAKDQSHQATANQQQRAQISDNSGAASGMSSKKLFKKQYLFLITSNEWRFILVQ